LGGIDTIKRILPIFNKKIQTSERIKVYFQDYDFMMKVHIFNGFFKEILGGKQDSWGFKAVQVINKLFKYS